ncbi:hypothetical protein YC2023_059242 [Brassica napus]
MARALVIINCTILAIQNCRGPIIMRLYFNNGGNMIWFSTFQLSLFPSSSLYLNRHIGTLTTGLGHKPIAILTRSYFNPIIIKIYREAQTNPQGEVQPTDRPSLRVLK